MRTLMRPFSFSSAYADHDKRLTAQRSAVVERFSNERESRFLEASNPRRHHPRLSLENSWRLSRCSHVGDELVKNGNVHTLEVLDGVRVLPRLLRSWGEKAREAVPLCRRGDPQAQHGQADG